MNSDTTDTRQKYNAWNNIDDAQIIDDAQNIDDA